MRSSLIRIKCVQSNVNRMMNKQPWLSSRLGHATRSPRQMYSHNFDAVVVLHLDAGLYIILPRELVSRGPRHDRLFVTPSFYKGGGVLRRKPSCQNNLIW